jgi:hypothetical protein
MNDLEFYKTNYLKLVDEKKKSAWGNLGEQLDWAISNNEKLQAQLNEANRFIDCLEAETSSMDMCKKIESYREKYKVVSNE